MKRTRHQRGYVYRKGNLWFVRYYDDQVQPDGTIHRIQKAHKLAEAVGNYRPKKAALVLAGEFLAPLNDGRATPQSTMTLTNFVEGTYLPFVQAQKRVSTFHGYRNMWKAYLKPHGYITLRDFTTADGERILGAVAKTRDLTSTTLRHLKAFLSGVFRHAKRHGVIYSENPMRDVLIPKARTADDTYAYSLEEIVQMLNILSEPAATIVAAAASQALVKASYVGFSGRITMENKFESRARIGGAMCRNRRRKRARHPYLSSPNWGSD